MSDLTGAEHASESIARSDAFDAEVAGQSVPSYVVLPANEYIRRKVIDALLGVVILLASATLGIVGWAALEIRDVIKDTNLTVSDVIPAKDRRITELEQDSINKDVLINEAVEYIIARCAELNELGRECPPLTLQEGK